MRLLYFLLPRHRAWLLPLLLVLGIVPAAWATHIVGGELDLQYQSGDTYQLSMNLYFDAINGQPGALDNVLTAGIFDKATNQRLALVDLPLTTSVFVPYTNPACAVGQLSTKQLLYRSLVQLPASVYNSPQGYYVAVERCCRNRIIDNIVNPDQAAQTFYLEFPAVVRGGQAFRDSTPRIFPPLADYACLGEVFTYDFGGQDADRDSLVYDMVTPLNGHANTGTPKPDPLAAPYSLVSWNPGLGTANQIPGSPSLSIGARTGRLTVRPTRQGLFVFGVRCQEFRRGVKLGETRRDFQLLVLACATNAPPSVVALPGSSGSTPYRPGRDTLRIVPGGPRCLRLRYTDPDRNSQLTLSVRDVDYGGPLPTLSAGILAGTVHAAGQPDTLAATLCFPDCADTGGRVRHLDVLVADNGCSLPKHDTVHIAFTATLPPNTPPVLSSTFPRLAVSTSATPAPMLVRVPLGSLYQATLAGLDAERDVLTLSGAGQGFDLAAAGMRLAVAPSPAGQAAGTFTWLPQCDASTVQNGQAHQLTVVFRLQEATCRPQPQTLTVRFEVVNPDSTQFTPPNIILPTGPNLANREFTLNKLPPDFCDSRFAEIRIYSRWGRQVFQAADRNFRWAGEGMAGTYYYLLTYTTGRRFKGWVEVMQ